MKISCWILLAGLAVGSPSCCSHAPEAPRARTKAFGVEIQAHRAPNGHLLLTVYLRNRSPRRLSLDANCLPWRPYGMTLVLVAEDTYSSVLERTHVIADSTPGDTASIEPEQTVSGDLDLSQIYPQLNTGPAERGSVRFLELRVTPRPSRAKCQSWRLALPPSRQRCFQRSRLLLCSLLRPPTPFAQPGAPPDPKPFAQNPSTMNLQIKQEL